MADPGAYNRRLEILRAAEQRDEEGGVVQIHVLVKKVWSRLPSVSPTGRRDILDRDASETRCQYLVRNEAVAGIQLGDILRDGGSVGVIIGIFPGSHEEMRITCEHVSYGAEGPQFDIIVTPDGEPITTVSGDFLKTP